MNTNFYTAMYQLPRRRWTLKPWVLVAVGLAIGGIAWKVTR